MSDDKVLKIITAHLTNGDRLVSLPWSLSKDELSDLCEVPSSPDGVLVFPISDTQGVVIASSSILYLIVSDG